MKNIRLIEDYLENRLKGDELARFEENLETDGNLRMQVEFHKEINESILDDKASDLRNQISHSIKSSNNFFKQQFRFLYIAAAAIVIGIMLFNKFHSPSPMKAFNQYYMPYNLDLSIRSVADSKTGFELALLDYANGNYTDAYSRLDSFLKGKHDHIPAKYYSALCAIELESYSEAEQKLKVVVGSRNKAYATHARWYLSLIYLQEGKKELAKPLLSVLQESNFYAERAKKIMRKYYN